MILSLLAYSEPLYQVDLEFQYQILLILFVAYGLSSVIRLTISGKLKYFIFIIFTVSYATLWYILMLDQSILSRILAVGVCVVGCVSGVSPGVRYLLRKFKNLGDDDSYFR
jgi:hypothetical protein